MLKVTRTMLAATAAFAAAAMAVPAVASDKPSKTEDRLLAAGFIIRPASTPAMQTMLSSLPQHKFLRRTNGEHVSFVYADSNRCGCLYVGSQQAYGSYERMAQAQKIANENEMTADDFQDANWDWGPWGGGGFGPWFGWGPGLGW